MSYVYKTAKTREAMLKIIQDDDAESPREWDNLGTLVMKDLIHYSLGDEQKSTEDLLRELAESCTLSDDIIIQQGVSSGHAKTDGNSYYLGCEKYVGSNTWQFKWDEEITPYDEVAQELWDYFTEEDHFNLALNEYILIPVDFYDYGGGNIGISSGSVNTFDERADGYIYISFKDIQKEYGSLTEEAKQRAIKCLEAEIKIYDQYLQGEVYGYKFIKFDQEKIKQYMERYEVEDFDDIPDEDLEDLGEEDSCWGYYGDDFEENGLAECIPDEFKPLIKDLAYVF